MPYDAATAGAEGNPYRDFASSSRRLAEQQGCGVATGNEKNRAHRAQQEVERETNVTHHVVLHSGDADGAVLIGIGILLRKTAGDGSHFGLRLCEGNARFQPSDSEVVLARATLRRRLGGYGVGWIPEIGLIRKPEARRQYPCNRHRLSNPAHDLAKHMRISAKMALPVRIADHQGATARLQLLR